MTIPVKRALAPFGVSVFTEYTALANRHGAINLSQGFPDFDGPDHLIEAATAAMRAGHNQYAPSHGIPELRNAIAGKAQRLYGMDPDPDAEVTVFSGATEALFSSIMALVEPGDEVVLFEPAYDSYAPSVAMAGGVARYVPLLFPDFRVEEDAVRAAMGPRTKLVVLNTPMNPTGKVFTEDELRCVGRLAQEFGALVLCDEVYEHITYGVPHVPLATLPGMAERTLTISSTAKTFSMTGWKIGYAIAPPDISAAIRMAHQFVTFASATPLQHAMAQALERSDAYYEAFGREYDRRRRLLDDHLHAAGFATVPRDGTYYTMADITPLGFDDDAAFCRWLPEAVGVAAIPVSAFYRDRREGRNLVRFAFCKRRAVLREAGERLAGLRERL
jgi:N-succinyldiaminopimelate aminotransferase